MKKYIGLRITGVLLLVLGVALIILQLVAKEKSVVASIAAGSLPITTGCVMVGMLRMMERRKASGDPSDTPK